MMLTDDNLIIRTTFQNSCKCVIISSYYVISLYYFIEQLHIMVLLLLVLLLRVINLHSLQGFITKKSSTLRVVGGVSGTLESAVDVDG